MKLAALLAALPDARVPGNPAVEDIEVHGLTDDSRAVGTGDVFVALRGLRADGHDYAATAIAHGAAAVVVERELPAHTFAATGAVQVVVPSSEQALGTLASAMAGRAAERLGLVGITGTNGKTTTTYLVESILRAAGHEPGVIGTVSYRYGGRSHPAPYTTPTPLVLHGTLADMERAGCSHAVLEASSIALSMGRLAAVAFQVAAFTNLTQDHLDVHGSMDAYRDAKALLFRRHLAPGGTAVINTDDPAASHMIGAAAGERVLRVSAGTAACPPDTTADVHVVTSTSTVDGIRAELATPRGRLGVHSRALLGGYNVANIALAAAIGEALALPHDAIARGIADMPGVPGRVERVANAAGLDILVDYAHTPDAVHNLLAALEPLTRGRLICVFGCGGDRDPDKRPKMGAAASALADLVVVTSDNPRTEDPRAIIEMILPGVPDPFLVEPDRGVAIQAAVAEAAPGDIVAIAGKGHEDYQIVGTVKHHFDDREEAARAAAMRESFPLSEIARVLAAEPGGATVHHGDAVDAADYDGDGDTSVRESDSDGSEDIAFGRVIIDGRIAAPGDLYVAIRGERFDGHAFCAQAIAAGARGVVVARGRVGELGDLGPLPAIAIEVDDPRAALGAIARWHRRRWAARPRQDGGRRVLVGVTGSAGKTTTKDLIAAALAAPLTMGGRVHKSAGSLNNETGVPLTLLGLRPFHDFAVVEMGMRALGEIAYLANVAEPDVGVVVNAGVAHVGVVGSADAISKGKSEIFQGVAADGWAVFPAADERLAGPAHAAPHAIGFGEAGVAGADVSLVSYAPRADGADLVISVNGIDIPASLRLPGRHNAINATCAVAAAIAAGVPAEQAARGLCDARPPAMRGQIARHAGRSVLVDCYNANPASMRAALHTLAELRDTASAAETKTAASGADDDAEPGTARAENDAGPSARAVAVVGDMLELGDHAADAHRALGACAAELGIEVIALGAHAGDYAQGATARGGTARVVTASDAAADDADQAARAVLATTEPGDWVLVKASRGARLERVVKALAALAAADAADARPEATP